MALKYVAVQSGGEDTNDPVVVRNATRPSTWPQIPVSSEILDDRVYLLFDATGDYCLPQFKLVFTGDVVCEMHLYKDRTLFRTDTITLTNNTFNTTQYDASADYNYVLVEISGGTITELHIAVQTQLKYNNQSGTLYNSSQILEISGKLDAVTDIRVPGNTSGYGSHSLTYFGVKKTNGTYTCGLSNCINLVAITDYYGSNASFTNCYKLRALPLIDTSSQTNFSNMFKSCFSLTTIPQLDTSSGTNFTQMFNNCYSLITVPQLDTSNGTNFTQMFAYCRALTTIPQLNTSSGADFTQMFEYCQALETIPQLDTSSGTTFKRMFYYCQALDTIPQLNTSNGTNFNGMFDSCYTLITIPQLDTSDGTNMGDMFRDCRSLTAIPQLDTSSVTDMSNMFYCFNLVSINGTVIRKSASLSSCAWMPHDELVEIIGNLPDLTGGTAQTLTLGSTLRNKLSADEIAVATNKNWTVA